MSKIIINFTPTGMIPTKEMTPYVPIKVTEIISEVKRAIDLGITMVHLHARDENGVPTYHKDFYAEIIKGIRDYNHDIVIVVSTSGRAVNTFETRSEVLSLEGYLKPDLASLTLGSFNFTHDVSHNSPEMIVQLMNEMNKKGIVPEFEVFDLGMMNYLKYLLKKFNIVTPVYINIIFGNISGAQANLYHIATILHDLPNNALISFGGIGDAQFPINKLAIALGYGVRVGLEDNIWYDTNRSKLASNYELIERIHRLINASEHEMMHASELRELLNLSSKK